MRDQPGGRRGRLPPPVRATVVLLVAALSLLPSSAPAQPAGHEPGERTTCPDGRDAPRLDEPGSRAPRRRIDAPGEPPSPWGPRGQMVPPPDGPFPGPDGLVCWPHGDHVHCRRGP